MLGSTARVGRGGMWTLFLLAFSVLGGCTSAAPQKARIVVPAAPCVLPPGPFDIVATVPSRDGASARNAADALTLDGQPLAVRQMRADWMSPEASVLVARPHLESGEHRLAIGASSLRVTVEKPSVSATRNGPGRSLRFRHHPPLTGGQTSVDCQSCHPVTQPAGTGEPILGQPKIPADCFGCHDKSNFELDHTHRLDSLSACTTCHDPHGGIGPRLLKGTPKKLCSACHD